MNYCQYLKLYSLRVKAHDVDYIRNILNDEVNSVYATGTSSTTELKDAGIYDNATMLMKFNKGMRVILRY